ncbi:mannose receptor, C type 1a, partial [Elysia marginata]
MNSFIGLRVNPNIFFSIFLLCSLFIAAVETFKVQCDKSWTLSTYSGSCVRFIYEPQTDWLKARKSCQQGGADLLRVFGREMNAFIADQMVDGLASLYIGIHMYRSVFYWRDRKPNSKALYANKIGQQISYGARYVCGALTAEDDWDFVDCSYKRGYICEKGPELCPAGWVPMASSGTCIRRSEKKLTWREARQECQTDGSDLVMILNAKTNLFIK